MYQRLEDAVRDIWGEDVAVQSRQSVSGGDINEAYHLLLSNGEDAFLKLNSKAADNFFTAEAHGLKAMAEAGANVPQVLACGKAAEGTKFLLLGYEKRSRPTKGYWSLLGQMLANMHSANTEHLAGGKMFGFYEDNFIGATRQTNSPKSGWVEFFREVRLGAQMHLASHYFDKGDRHLCQRLLDRLGDFLTEPKYPSLLHGDLWSGNVMPDRNGHPMLIDPAVYVGHHEADLAMTELFGGFSPEFYDAYHERVPKESGYVDRRDIYNLYHLLNHLNLFGGAYLTSVRRILKRYAG